MTLRKLQGPATFGEVGTPGLAWAYVSLQWLLHCGAWQPPPLEAHRALSPAGVQEGC